VAVNNALPALKKIADYVTPAPDGTGINDLIDRIIEDDHAAVSDSIQRHFLPVGVLEDNRPFLISPYRSGILVSGLSGAGKSTFTLSVVESLANKGYQFCLVDPEGDYLDLPDTVVIGNSTVVPSLEEIAGLLKNPAQNVVICALSVPLPDRPAFFSKLLPVLLTLRKDYGHPHWILLDESHHLMPSTITSAEQNIPGRLVNFMLITNSPGQLNAAILAHIGVVITIGEDSHTPIEEFCSIRKCEVPVSIPPLSKGEACVWNLEANQPPFLVRVNMPARLLHRHKKKYAEGDMADNSFIFTGPENKLQLKANNLLMFVHLAEGVDDDTWLYHLHRGDYKRWAADCIHDDELVAKIVEAENATSRDAALSRKIIIDYIKEKYTL
jgi:hypothetical protein